MELLKPFWEQLVYNQLYERQISIYHTILRVGSPTLEQSNFLLKVRSSLYIFVWSGTDLGFLSLFPLEAILTLVGVSWGCVSYLFETILIPNLATGNKGINLGIRDLRFEFILSSTAGMTGAGWSRSVKLTSLSLWLFFERWACRWSRASLSLS